MFKIKRELCIPYSKSIKWLSYYYSEMKTVYKPSVILTPNHNISIKIEGKCIILILTGSTISAPMYQLYTKLIALYESSYWGRNSSEVVVWTTSEQPEHQHLSQVMNINIISYKSWATTSPSSYELSVEDWIRKGSGQFHTAHPRVRRDYTSLTNDPTQRSQKNG